MVKNGKIALYRQRLDKTLACPDLSNLDALRSLIRNQLVKSVDVEGCDENIVEKRTTQLSFFLDMLRSGSAEFPINWKLHKENEDFRVMYRKGPEGTPFHTLLVEGYVDGPIDVCLCISWESSFYDKWWPQFNIPSFRIISSRCLQKVRIGEHISLVRVKVTWPLTAREAVLHYFLFNYLQDDLVVVLLNTMSSSDDIYTVPDANDVARIDLVGGFAIQKVNPERSYFRTIANMDLKLDLVPPSIINFILRQVIGSSFRLYQKAVASFSDWDGDYSNALEDVMYARIREAVCRVGEPSGTNEEKMPEMEEHDVDADDDSSEYFSINSQATDAESSCDIKEMNRKDQGCLVKSDGRQRVNSQSGKCGVTQDGALLTDRRRFGEIEEESEALRCLPTISNGFGEDFGN